MLKIFDLAEYVTQQGGGGGFMLLQG
jgi:hypothetical protein